MDDYGSAYRAQAVIRSPPNDNRISARPGASRGNVGNPIYRTPYKIYRSPHKIPQFIAMGLGILEDTKLEHVPGTALLTEIQRSTTEAIAASASGIDTSALK